MTDVERAIEYLAIFINVGDKWRNFVPVDGEMIGVNRVRIGSVEVWPEGDCGDSWRLYDGEQVRRFRKAVTA